jgi:hypothetical protein
VVSGGASGIGAACAERLRAEGAVVSTRDLAHDAAVHCDVTDPASVAEALRTTVNSVGTPTLHVAAAGIIGPIAPFYDVSPDGFDRVVAVNLKGVFLIMAAVARAIIAAELDGSMVAISSQTSVIVDPLIFRLLGDQGGCVPHGQSRRARPRPSPHPGQRRGSRTDRHADARRVQIHAGVRRPSYRLHTPGAAWNATSCGRRGSQRHAVRLDHRSRSNGRRRVLARHGTRTLAKVPSALQRGDES